jgi:lipopolysaccharide export system protein LptC
LSQYEALRTSKPSDVPDGRTIPQGSNRQREVANTSRADSRRVSGAGPGSPSNPNFGAAGFDMSPARSRGGFKAASRHTARVRWFRRAAITGSLLLAVLIPAVVLLNPLRRLPVDVSIGKVGVDGTKITVDSPKITGIQKNGHPFEIRARSGIQDIAVPNITELLGIDSKIGAADASTTWVRAARGVYDNLHDKMTLEGNIQIKNSSGYDIRLETARIDFKTGGLVSDGPVKVNLAGGTVAAQQLDVSDNGHKVSFGGDVNSVLDSGADEPVPSNDSTGSLR